MTLWAAREVALAHAKAVPPFFYFISYLAIHEAEQSRHDDALQAEQSRHDDALQA